MYAKIKSLSVKINVIITQRRLYPKRTTNHNTLSYFIDNKYRNI